MAMPLRMNTSPAWACASISEMAMKNRLLLTTLAVILLGAGTLYLGGAIQWSREAPYALQQSWGGLGSEPGQFNEPTGIAVSESEVFVSDARNARIQVFDKQGRFLHSFNEGLQRPMNLDIHCDELFVADFFADAILVYGLDGRLRQTIRAQDGLKNPGGAAVRSDGSLLVADTYRHRIVHLNREGKVLRIWGNTDQIGSSNSEFSYPTDVAVTPNGGFYVADGYNDRVQQFDAKGQFVRKWGGPFGMNIFGPFKGWLATATSIAVAPDGKHVFVADFYNDRIQKFCDQGFYFTSFGSISDSSTHTAIAIDVDQDGNAWVANYADHRVEKWAPPQADLNRLK